MIYLGIDNKSNEYALVNSDKNVKELSDENPDILWYSTFDNLEEVNKFLEWYENENRRIKKTHRQY